MQANALEKFENDFSAMVRARYPLIFINTFEETRCLERLTQLNKTRSCPLYVWARTQGLTREGKPVMDAFDPLQALRWYDELSEKSMLVLKDFHPYMKEPGVVRKLRDLGHALKRSQKTVILLSPVLMVPPELAKELAVVELPLPNRDEIAALIQKASSVLSPQDLEPKAIEEVTDAATGLTYDEIENVLAKSIVSRGTLDRKVVQEEKKATVKRSGLLEFVETDRVASVGGLGPLKSWLKTRRAGLSAEARKIGLPVPKGILLVGIPGCGKSLTAMTVGREWELPLLRLDLGRLFSGLVGSSESNVRSALATCEAVAPCILWVDEIEKGLSGAQGSGTSDGGTTSRVFGTLLTWMQEKQAPVFVVATANDISQLPPEFLRKGRFDEIFFVDLPSAEERVEIFKIQLSRYQWEVEGLNFQELIERTEGFSGSEIEQVVVAGRYLAFGESQAFSQRHLCQAAQETVPLSKTMADRIEALRNWASHRARPASAPPSDSSTNDRFTLRTNSLELGSLASKKAGETC